jgi:hypothetical protein
MSGEYVRDLSNIFRFQAETFVSNGSADALNAVTNPDGSITNLVFDVHKYLDSDNSGTHPECVTNNIDNAFAPLAQWLRCHGRKAFNTETGTLHSQDMITDPELIRSLKYLRRRKYSIVFYVPLPTVGFPER